MGKKGQTKDRGYTTASEWKNEGGGAKDQRTAVHHTLPFWCCALSFLPFGDDVVCTDDGTCFDLLNIVPYVRKHGKHPLTKQPLALKDLTRLHFHKNANDEFACPILNKAFTEATRIVAVKTTGNVFSFTAVDELNIKPKHFRDLISDVPFTRADVITLQDPMALRERTVDPVEASSVDPVEARRMFAEAKGEATPGGRALVARGAPAERTSAITAVANGEEARPSAARAGSLGGNGGMRSTGWAAASFTSTSMKIQTRNEAAEVPKSLITRKAYASLHTNLGILNLELHADVTPKAVENFLILARRGYFNATVCHRLIKNFMAQFGDPTGTGSGGESAWGGSFADEFSSKLSHNARGTVSMANSGPASNKSQFFLTFRPTPHLDHKHTVFGRVVGGLETTLAAIERVPTDKEDSPRQAISILSVTIHDDPFTAAAGDPRGSVVGADAVSIECGPVEHAPRPRAVAPPAKKAKLGYGTFNAF